MFDTFWIDCTGPKISSLKVPDKRGPKGETKVKGVQEGMFCEFVRKQHCWQQSYIFSSEQVYWRAVPADLHVILDISKDCGLDKESLITMPWPSSKQLCTFLVVKHRKNCECCPVSLLIVRQQRMSWIQVLNCKNCNQCLKCHKSLGLSLSLSLSVYLSLSLSFFWSGHVY